MCYKQGNSTTTNLWTVHTKVTAAGSSQFASRSKTISLNQAVLQKIHLVSYLVSYHLQSNKIVEMDSQSGDPCGKY